MIECWGIIVIVGKFTKYAKNLLGSSWNEGNVAKI